MRVWFLFFLGMIGFITSGSYSVLAKETDAVISKQDQTTILSDSDHYDGRKELLLGLRIKLAPGWHTYWINPGDAGEPASVSAQINNSGAQEGKIMWPSPEQLTENGLMSYIYKGDVILPFKVLVPDDQIGKDLNFKVKARWLVCADVCIPEEGEFVFDLPKGQASISPDASLIQQALSKKPKKSPWDVYITSSGKLWVKQEGVDPALITKAWFMPEKSGIIDQVASQTLYVKPGLLTLDIPLAVKKELQQPVHGVLAIQDGQNQIQHFSVQAKVAPLSTPVQTSLLLLIGSAFLGGILLNLMPCVFPVIAMKLLSLSRIGQEHINVRYKSSIAYTAGILCCFIIMAFAFVGLRWMGSQLGWGFQFQSAGFVILLCWLLFVISLNFLGVFNVQFSLNNTGPAGRSSEYSSDFFTGLLAVLVATPCTAPFMGIAIAGALNAPLWISILIFVGMGLGLALPYVLFACVPSFARILPRPGLWMDILKQLLAFPLLLSCLWLAWVVYQHQQSMSFFVLLSGFTGLGFVCWAIGLIQQLYMQGIYRVFRIFFGILIVLILCLLGGGFYFFVHDQNGKIETQLKENVMTYSAQKLELLRKDHKPVFINMTASWCLTCMVNDKVALSSTKVQEAFKHQHITYMVGDWTQYDKSIGDFLKAHGREGVPLYIYYPAYGKPKILPQILTSNIVLSYLSDLKK
ncbi:protein-disulfide reductase DsbD family protein [Commensalibacter papalotli (ex Servin-Garciduenas et al. 2014)]|uniref:Thiol:disulfide interchange protein DsbD n=1 Tax=Commensalibacter papalotli (ex Servin-Garciduenas et al. 2014) TaxID=1208583 RepID=W7DTM8_9PROT|nr:protein-disulfide reductase DsbD domain-containing protein [Commensalibacter papalotli (ex Servin-Garciduenas et al. 2014)]EUK18315.1 thiol:disulfide interchange protein DsbD [Commensalibacter papalotli (ex Servin-Garciduenas et al. 2014)]